jgi:F0F1-type ATP synthase epsilon subunit
MNTTSRIVLAALVGIFLFFTILYVRSQQVKLYAKMIVIEELREEVEIQRRIAEEQKEMAEFNRMVAEKVRIECEKQLMELKK